MTIVFNRSINFLLPWPCPHQVRRRADLAVGWNNDTAGFGKEDKMPKKSHKQSFKFANFPQNLINNLKQTCKTPISSLSKHFKERNDLAERKAVKMNKLESFFKQTNSVADYGILLPATEKGLISSQRDFLKMKNFDQVRFWRCTT